MAQVGGAIRRAPPRLEVRLPLTGSADIAFGLVLRRPRRRRRKRSALKQWTRVVTTAACCVIAADPERVRTGNAVAFEPADVTIGRVLLIPMPGGRYAGFRLVVSDAPRVFAPRIRWPTEGIVTQLFSQIHTGVDIAAPYGSAVVASDSGTVTEVGWRGPGGLSVCVLLDWGLEICDYHLSATQVELGERVVAGQRIASVGSSGVSTGPHVHWEARTNGVLVDPMTYAPAGPTVLRVGGATGSP